MTKPRPDVVARRARGPVLRTQVVAQKLLEVGQRTHPLDVDPGRVVGHRDGEVSAGASRTVTPGAV